MKLAINPSRFVTASVAVAGALLFAGCDGSSGGGTTGSQTQISSPTLMSVSYGRLVDVYSYQRIDSANADRRDTVNRRPVLIERNVVVSSEVETEELYDAIGGERPSANYRFLPFNTAVGHEELLILWDDRDPLEGARFQDALDKARGTLSEVPASFRGQNVQTRPIPVVPRNAAIKLTFDSNLNIDSTFFAANPAAIQLLRFIDDPGSTTAQAAFLPATFRVLPSGDALVIDTTLIGGEAVGSNGSTGLEPSGDQVTANFRIAIPTDGVAARELSVKADEIPELNDVDSNGDTAVIRDFRSGNLDDGRVGALADVEPPTIVGEFDMGLLEVDRATATVRLNKRIDALRPQNSVAIRGRIPFVDGAISPTTNLPGGRSTVPTLNTNQTRESLTHGDMIMQDVVSPVTGEIVTIRAEVIENLEVGRKLDDAEFPAPGLTLNGTQGHELPEMRLRLSTVSGFDSAGNEVFMNGDTVNPLGSDCRVITNYYEFLPYSGEFGVSASVSDSIHRWKFLVFDPSPVVPEGEVGFEGAVRFADPLGSVGLRFSEPMDLASINTLDNYLFSTDDVHVGNITDVLANSPKGASLSFRPSRLIDQNQDGTLLKILPPMGHYHEEGQQELYWFHAVLAGVQDLSGNDLDIFDRRAPAEDFPIEVRRNGQVVTQPTTVPLESFSVQFEMLEEAQDNLVGSRVFRFENVDEDGSAPGSVDFFGQFRLANGHLIAAETTRFSANVDGTSLAGVERFLKGECVDPALGNTAILNNFAASVGGPPGIVYQTPSVVNLRTQPFPTVFQPPGPPVEFGGIAEPHVRRGSRLQATYREDDMGLEYHRADQMNIDIEQMHWAPWNDQSAFFDSFDRYSLLLGHGDKRPDMSWYHYLPPGDPPPPEVCDLECTTLNSGLSVVYNDNILQGSEMKRVVDEATYVVNPALAFRSGNVKYVPYPEFQTTYTWRDSRLVSWDMTLDVAIGLGGARDPGTAISGDRTASVSSPWCPDDPSTSVDGDLTGFDFPVGQFVRDAADFLGDRQRDHDPIALPLLMEFRMFPDDTVQAASSNNLFHIGHIGPQFSDIAGNPPVPNGYYNGGPFMTLFGNNTQAHAGCTNAEWPIYRVHSTGGIDLVDGNEILIDPDFQPTAVGGVITDIGLGALPHTGLFRTEPGDSHVYWGQVDFVRRVSMATGGFFDSLRPNRHGFPAGEEVEGMAAADADLPQFDGAQVGVGDLVVVLDPPNQVGGATMNVEIRGAQQIGPDGVEPTIYTPVSLSNEQGQQIVPGDDNPLTRGNLLNANYSCEAYRYATSGATAPGQQPGEPRVPATGLTPYARTENLDDIRDVRGVLPRFLNFRLVMENNISSTPNVSPSLRGMSIVYRMRSLTD